LLGVPLLGATITLHHVARVCQRQLGFLVLQDGAITSLPDKAKTQQY